MKSVSHMSQFRVAWMLHYGAANMQESSRWVSAQALSGFVALSHENSKIALPQTAKCGMEQRGGADQVTAALQGNAARGLDLLEFVAAGKMAVVQRGVG